MKLFKIGELADATGVTVRTLHHYDRIGLLHPTTARESGHRLYSQNDVERLQQIISLKSMGLSLQAIGRCLDEGAYDLRETLAMQQQAVAAQVASLQSIHKDLGLMLSRLGTEKTLPAQELLNFIREVHNMEKIYTPEQLKKLQHRYETYPDKVKEVEAAWPVLFKKFEEAMRAGLPISDLKVQVLAAEAQHYIDLFTGGDREIEARLDKFATEQQEHALTMWNVSKEVFDYANRARLNIKSVKPV